MEGAAAAVARRGVHGARRVVLGGRAPHTARERAHVHAVPGRTLEEQAPHAANHNTAESSQQEEDGPEGQNKHNQLRLQNIPSKEGNKMLPS